MKEISSYYVVVAGHERKGAMVFTAGVVFMAAMIFLGYSIDDELRTYGIKALQERNDPVMGLVFLFAFGFPLGVVTVVAGALFMGQARAARVVAMTLSGVLLVSLAALTPAVFGRELSKAYFGTGGMIIAVCMVVSFWYWTRYRSALPQAARSVADIKALGYMCFGLAAWNTCGFATMPSFGLYPDLMLAQGVRPFAIGQAKAIMAYFVLGWVFTALGFYKSAKIRDEHP
jgi:hypothetical protein